LAGTQSEDTPPTSVHSGSSKNRHVVEGDIAELVCQVEALEKPLGKGLYRGLLKTLARVWRPSQIQNVGLLRKLLAHMQAVERGLQRLEVAVGVTGPEALARILESLKLDSMEKIDNLETLKEVVL